MVDASGLGTTVVYMRTEKDLTTIIKALKSEEELVLTYDLIIDDKILDEGKTLCLLGKEMMKSITHLKVQIAQNHTLNDRGGFRPPVQLAFANMAGVGDSAKQITRQIKEKDEEKLAKERAAEEEADREEDRKLIEEAGDLSYSYAFKGRDWNAPEVAAAEDTRRGNERFVSGGDPRKLAEVKPASSEGTSSKLERMISKYMTAEPNAEGVQKVYIEDPEVIQCKKEDIQVTFSADFYNVRVNAPSAVLVLGPVNCGRIDHVASSWRLSPGKRLTLTLAATTETKTEARMKREWEEKQAKLKAAEESGQKPKAAVQDAPASNSVSKT
eukprot:CAMPEP_0178393334 /NCGR_PEP_ID=MMETSP0689_2-20121128/12132_1 /TAXON_ID=160604 /ORGANISM="Amphidinium massartii, Strain CS-259" /LENGTH=326 /DNA_ID=CAMNT_0020013919 /DNA_START=80 /DNA_END=1056 /DNA_ORIENTATION=-